MQSDPKLLFIYDKKTIATKALNLSAFTVLAFTDDPNVKNRVNTLFGRGVRKIGHLINLP